MDALDQRIFIANIGSKHKIKSSAWMRLSLRLPLGSFAAIWICTMLQQPVESDWIERLAGSEDDRVDVVPGGIHVGSVPDEQFHHGRAPTMETPLHERRGATFVNVLPVVEKPLCYREPAFGRFIGPATFTGPRQRSISAIADRRMFKFGVFGNKAANFSE